MKHLLSYTKHYFFHSPAIRLSYFTHESISLSALVTYLSPCYHTNSLYKLLDVTDLHPKLHIICHYISEINFDLSN